MRSLRLGQPRTGAANLSMPKPKRTARAALPPISDAEWVVMKVVWDKAPVTANGVVETLAGRTDWKPKTIHTLLRRLVQKGAVDFDKQGREHVFRPLVEAQHCLHAASRSFLQRVFGGGVAPFLACLLKQERLTREEIAELRRILDQAQT
jgi:BlaI family penicillinase repressor